MHARGWSRTENRVARAVEALLLANAKVRCSHCMYPTAHLVVACSCTLPTSRTAEREETAPTSARSTSQGPWRTSTLRAARHEGRGAGSACIWLLGTGSHTTCGLTTCPSTRHVHAACGRWRRPLPGRLPYRSMGPRSAWWGWPEAPGLPGAWKHVPDGAGIASDRAESRDAPCSCRVECAFPAPAQRRRVLCVETRTARTA